jgi:transposase
MYVHGIRSLFAFAGYVVEKITIARDLAQVNLRRDRRFGLRCPDCGTAMAVNRTTPQTAKDLPLGTAELVVIRYEAVQGRCSHCGSFATIHPPGIDPNAKATRRLMHLVCRLARHMPLNHVPDVVPISESTAGRWDRKVLGQGLPEPNLDGLRILLIDEKAVRKRHGYVTLVMNGENGELLHMAEGKKKASLQSFFDKLSEQQKKGVVAVAMDRAGAYREVVRRALPDADVVFDKFHVIANYNKVIDRVRRQEWREAHAEDKSVIKGQRYNLFRLPENRTVDQTHSLYRLLAINENLMRTHVLGDALRPLWGYTYRGWAAKHFDKWVGWAKECGVEAVAQFASSLSTAKEEILNYCKHRITTGPLEAFNNVVSRILHRACGMQDLGYLFLKLRQESLDFVPQR